jgi:arabinofuranosyltransferase
VSRGRQSGRKAASIELPPQLEAVRQRVQAWAETLDPIAIALVVVPLAVFVFMAWRWRWTHDDGFITLRVVDQVFAGHGPVYNTGQRVEVFTSPLHLGLLIVLRALFGWFVDEAWLGALLTIASMVAGFVGAVEGAARLARAGGAKGRFLPLGILVPVALPPMWEYATSGLETGIAIGWIGVSFWLVAVAVTRGAEEALVEADGALVQDDASAAATRRRPRRYWIVAMVSGLGPLVRPECTIFSIALLAVLLTSTAVGTDRKRRLRLVGAAVALPVAYEIFRMGYYASLIPNTALAKEAGGSRWGQGWYYLVNFSAPYGLLLPLLVFGVWAWMGHRGPLARSFGGRDGLNLVAAMGVGALIYGLYVVRVGGDYMHARMLLPPAFALCCPLAVVAIPRAQQVQRVVFACVGTLVLWAGVVGVTRRAPKPEGFFGGHSISEQRPFWVTYAGNPHPVALDEWKRSFPYLIGTSARRSSDAGSDVLITQIADKHSTTQLHPGRGTVLYLDGIGVTGARAGVDIPVIDYHGLADPIASRLPPQHPRQLPGHEKVLPESWALAEAGLTDGDPELIDAAAALQCGEIHKLLVAIAAPMSPGRFFRNMVEAPGLTTLHISSAPSDSARGCAKVDG